MPKERPEVLARTPAGRSEKIAYATEFRDMLRENPGVIEMAQRLIDRALEEYNPEPIPLGERGNEWRYDKDRRKWLVKEDVRPFEERVKSSEPKFEWIPVEEAVSGYGRLVILAPGNTITESGLSITVLGRSNREFERRKDECDYIKVDFKGKSYFVKRSYVTIVPGFEEFVNTRLAKEVLADLSYVEVVEPQLGYQDNKESWYISQWREIETAGFFSNDTLLAGPDNYGKHLPNKETFVGGRGGYKLYMSRLNKILDKLYKAGISKDAANNVFYNPKTRKFIVLDVGSHTGEPLGEAVKKKG